ncbi:MAG: hypothetical protein BWY43_00144 [candidate division WS2 bacterium ADurb.Bin280]|uniref:Uncharacterized protein n=1 Tax=candidate division WS2 bacterium ADurb.Bin280 TaxID=1852829 RepID=A0A1V5SFF4_9BACT|nr:MAG: hypothetical protein BWY43_00144 [candidate division WS2 bacterium ADurb.Bin280]
MLVVILAGCSGEGFTPATVPDDVVVSHPIPAQPDGDVEVIGQQIWEVRGDLPSRPVTLFAVPAEALSLERLSPGRWRLTALSSWQCNVYAEVADQTVWSAHVITTRIQPDKLEIFVQGATRSGDGFYADTRLSSAAPVVLNVSWIDHGATGYPGWPGSPDVPVLWDVPMGVRVNTVGEGARRIEILPTEELRSGDSAILMGDVAGKLFPIVFIRSDGPRVVRIVDGEPSSPILFTVVYDDGHEEVVRRPPSGPAF